MKIKDIISQVEAFAPRESAEEWDNTGLALGNIERECSGILLALDLTLDVARQAVEQGCNLVLTHHPFFFHSASQIDTTMPQGEIVEMLIKNDITAYSAHTNLDKAQGGIGWVIAQMLDAKDIVVDGLGICFEVAPITLADFARKVSEKLSDNSVKIVGFCDSVISKVYLVSGGGGDNDLYARAKEVADVFVTGDVKHHIYIAAQNDGFPIVEYSHYASEIIVQDIFYNLLAPKCVGLNIIKAEQRCPFRLVEEI